MTKLYESYYERHYKSSCCSCVSLSTFVIYLVAIIAPFLFVYSTNGKYNLLICIGLYVEKQTFWEQPTVYFLNELLLEVLDADGVSHQYSTVKSLQDQCSNPLSQPSIKFTEFDQNSDGKKDMFWLRINFKMLPSQVRQVNLLGAFDYYLQDRLKLKMKGLVQMSVDTPDGASFIRSSG